MALQLQGATFRGFAPAPGGLLFQFEMIVDRNTVMLDCDHRIFRFLPVCIKLCRGEIDIVRLPDEWWVAHVHRWFRLGVNATAFIVLTL